MLEKLKEEVYKANKTLYKKMFKKQQKGFLYFFQRSLCL